VFYEKLKERRISIAARLGAANWGTIKSDF
jgi:hypothetical protein